MRALRTVAWWTGWLLLLAASRLQATETVTLYVTNAQGTVVAEMTPQGQVTYEATYRPYGAQVTGVPQAGPGYTGHVNDPDSGLVYMQARYYDPESQQFQSVDPVGPTLGNVFNFGRYVYANNNPLRFTDPDGRQSAGQPDQERPPGCSTSTDGCLPPPPPPPCSASCMALRYTSDHGGTRSEANAAVGVSIPLNLEPIQCGVNAICGSPPLAGRGKLVEGALGLLERALARLRGVFSVTGGAARATELLRPGGRLIGEAGSSPRVRILQGSQGEAEALFDQLIRETGATPISKEGLAGFAELPGEGGTIGLRSVSTSGPPTIDVRIPGLGIREIKFIP